MSSSFKNFMVFLLGVGCGAAATYYVVKKKCTEQANARADQEIASVREAYSRHEAKPNIIEYANSIQNKEEKSSKDSTITEYSELAKKYSPPDVIDYTHIPIPVKEPSPTEDDNSESEEELVAVKESNRKYRDPYVISPDSCGEVDYDIIGLTYYNDGVLTDDDDEPISDIKGTVGFDALKRFGDEDGAMIYVRNERLKCDYEVAFDKRKYKEMKRRKPHQVED